MPQLIEFSAQWTAFVVFFLIIMGFIGIADFLMKYLRVAPENSRKFVHVMVGILVSLAPFFLNSLYPVAGLGVLFTFLNYIALKKDTFRGMHSTDRISYGTIYFPVAFTLLVLLFWERNIVIFIISMLILTFSDTAATIVGERLPAEKKFVLWHDRKSYLGSATFFAVAFLIVWLGFPLYTRLAGGGPLPTQHLLLMSAFTAFLSTVGEAVSRRGSDNLTLTLAAALGLDIYLFCYSSGTLGSLFAWTLFSLLLGWGAYKLKALSASGGIGAFMLGVFMFGTGGWHTMLPLIGFFVLSSLLSKLADRRSNPDVIVSKGSRRDILQVYANGGIALILALLWYFSDFETTLYYYAFLASLASATADTWETEIGSFSFTKPIDILSWKRVEKGYSGGISLSGTLGGLAGAFTIPAIGVLSGAMTTDLRLILLIAVSGFIGTLVDSILGSSLQAKYQCPTCGKPTEKQVHCDVDTELTSGFRWLNNDWVNVAGSLSGALVFTLLYFSLSL